MNKNKNIPRRRFPEFKDSSEWEVNVLQKVANFINKKITLSNLKAYEYISTENILQDFAGIIKSNTFPSLGAATKFSVGDILISNIRPYLKKIAVAKFSGGASNDVIVVRANQSIDQEFLSFYLKNNVFINYVMSSAKGVKMPRGDIALIKQYPIFIPLKRKEQEIIAACLSSVDELITAQDDKIAALKEHKKGLMQKLFPKDGETTPHDRFPEFLNSPSWQEKPLSKIASKNNLKNKGLLIDNVLTNSAISGIVKQKDYFDKDIANKNNLSGYYVVDINDFIYNPRISSNAPVGSLKRNNLEKGIMSPLYMVFRFNSGDVAFFEHYFETTHWHNYMKSIANTGAKFDRLNIGNEQFFNLPIPFPSLDEQCKIAECLSSIDELISLHTEKLSALKEHKKGLMQQLFPAVEKE